MRVDDAAKKAGKDPFDFVFDKGRRGAIRITHVGDVEIVEQKENSFVFNATGNVFKIEATGFDPLRDLVIETKELEDIEPITPAEPAPAPEVKTVYVEVPKQEQYPFWLLHRKY